MHGIVKLVHASDDPDGPFMTVSEVAEHFEKDKDTIRRWGKVLGIPNHKMPLGNGEHENAFVWLYTEKDIEEFEKFSSGFSPKGGRPPKNREEETA